MDYFEYDFSHYSKEELKTLFDEAKKRCKSDELSDILKEVAKMLKEVQNN